jgi:type I restriction enzyme, S subunit
MEVIEKTYLKSTSLQLLQNWSVRYLLESRFSYNEKFELVPIGSFLKKSRNKIIVENGKLYQRVTVKINNGGVIPRDTEQGENIGTKIQYKIKPGQFLMSRIDARNGAFGLVPANLDGAIVTNDFPVFDVDNSKVIPEFLVLITTTKEFIQFAQSCSSGTTNRQRIDIESFLNVKIPLPPLSEQNSIVEAYNKKIKQAEQLEQKAKKLEEGIEKLLFTELGINSEIEKKEVKKGLRLVNYSKIIEWGTDKIGYVDSVKSMFFETTNFDLNKSLFERIFRGKSPKYNQLGSEIILNQKCNRWNYLTIEHAKKVNSNWINSVDSEFFTEEGDILINSTGEGTIGRASYVDKKHTGLLYDSHLLLLRINKSIINPNFFVELFNSSYGQSQVNNMKSAQTTKQTELGVSNLKKIFFPLAPMDIQNNIIYEIKKRKTEINKLIMESKKNRENALKDFEKEIFQPCN